jgi:hypothetical protein
MRRWPTSTVAELTDDLAAMSAELDWALDRLAQVVLLHTADADDRCPTCDRSWPCPTIEAVAKGGRP